MTLKRLQGDLDTTASTSSHTGTTAHLLDLLVSLAEELLAGRQQHLLVLALDFHLRGGEVLLMSNSSIVRPSVTRFVYTWAIPVTEMETPWPEFTLTEVTCGV